MYGWSEGKRGKWSKQVAKERGEEMERQEEEKGGREGGEGYVLILICLDTHKQYRRLFMREHSTAFSYVHILDT